MDDPNYENMTHDELLKLADSDSMAAAEFFYRYQYCDDPVLEAEVHSILKSLAEDFEIMGFWLEWYAALRDSADPHERQMAEEWRRKIVKEGAWDKEALVAYGVVEDNEAVKQDTVMKESESTANLTAADEAICAFFIEDASRLRRIVELMPAGNLPASLLNTLWAYAVKHDRLVDLANVFLGFDSNHRKVEGNGNCDWFWRCSLTVAPVRTNEFFFTLMTYARTRAHLANGTYDDWHDDALATYDWLTCYKEHDVGKGIRDIDYVLDQLLSKYESEVELERRLDMEGQYPCHPESANKADDVKDPDGRIFVGVFEREVSNGGVLRLPSEFRDELGRCDMCVVQDPAKQNALVLVPADFCEKELSRHNDDPDTIDNLCEAKSALEGRSVRFVTMMLYASWLRCLVAAPDSSPRLAAAKPV